MADMNEHWFRMVESEMSMCRLVRFLLELMVLGVFILWCGSGNEAYVVFLLFLGLTSLLSFVGVLMSMVVSKNINYYLSNVTL